MPTDLFQKNISIIPRTFTVISILLLYAHLIVLDFQPPLLLALPVASAAGHRSSSFHPHVASPKTEPSESLRGSSGRPPPFPDRTVSEVRGMESTINPYTLPSASSATKPIPTLRALRAGALLLLLTGALALPATPQQPSAPLPIATETGGHNDDRRHPEEASSIEEWPRQIQNEFGMEFVLIPAGTFRLGASGLRADPSEKPRHEVTITRPFYIGKYEMTMRGRGTATSGDAAVRGT